MAAESIKDGRADELVGLADMFAELNDDRQRVVLDIAQRLYAAQRQEAS